LCRRGRSLRELSKIAALERREAKKIAECSHHYKSCVEPD
jgi:hypothetical protein